MTTDIIIATILFALTLLVYCLLMPAIRIRRGKYGPTPIRVLVVSILVNCLSKSISSLTVISPARSSSFASTLLKPSSSA